MTAIPALEAVTLRAANGPERAFYFRPDTSDAAVINDVFRNGGYDLRRLDRTTKQRRHAEIDPILRGQAFGHDAAPYSPVLTAATRGA